MLTRVDLVLPDAAFQKLADASALVFDVDRTLADPHHPMTSDVVSELQKLRVPAGVATARSLSELEESLPSECSLGDVFKGHLLLEDGSVLVPGGQSKDTPLRVEALVSTEQLRAISRFRQLLQDAFVDLGREDGFGQLADLPEPLVKFPPYKDFLASVTLWEQGPVGDPSFIHAYNWCRERLREQHLDALLTLTEVGDGTLRVTIPGVHKGHGLNRLASSKRLDLSRVAYFGDGFNDVPAAEAVKAGGGLVVAIGSSTPSLVSLADYVTSGEGPDAVAKILHRLNRIAS